MFCIRSRCIPRSSGSAAIGIAEQHYQRFEGGVNMPNIKNAWKLADHFGVTIDYLIGCTDER